MKNIVSSTEALMSILPEVLGAIRRTLVDSETAYQRQTEGPELSSLWMHSLRVGRIAHYLAQKEGTNATAALLAGLFHDIGKFAHGKYHEDDVSEEATAAEEVKKLLSRTSYENLIPIINQAILSLYSADVSSSDIGLVLYDADRLDKLGNMGVAQFFAKNALRRCFLSDELMAQASIELTYAFHAPNILKTPMGRNLALMRSTRMRRFYHDLVEEWDELGLGHFSILDESIEGITVVFIIPGACKCGSGLDVGTDIKDSVKCLSAVVQYKCSRCGHNSEFSFCLPNVKHLA